MSLNARSVAVQGFGYSPRLKAVQGFAAVDIYVLPIRAGVGTGLQKRDPLLHTLQASAMFALSHGFRVRVSYKLVQDINVGVVVATESKTYDPNAIARAEEEDLIMTLLNVIN